MHEYINDIEKNLSKEVNLQLQEIILGALKDNPLSGSVLFAFKQVGNPFKVLNELKAQGKVKREAVVHFFVHIIDNEFMELFEDGSIIALKLRNKTLTVFDLEELNEFAYEEMMGIHVNNLDETEKKDGIFSHIPFLKRKQK